MALVQDVTILGLRFTSVTRGSEIGRATSEQVRERKKKPSIKDENGWTKSRPVLTVFLYLTHLFPYLRKNIETGREARRGVSYPYLRDPIFSWDDPILVPYL